MNISIKSIPVMSFITAYPWTPDCCLCDGWTRSIDDLSCSLTCRSSSYWSSVEHLKCYNQSSYTVTDMQWPVSQWLRSSFILNSSPTPQQRPAMFPHFILFPLIPPYQYNLTLSPSPFYLTQASFSSPLSPAVLRNNLEPFCLDADNGSPFKHIQPLADMHPIK